MGLSDGEGNGNGNRAVESARGPSSELAHSRPRIIFENVSILAVSKGTRKRAKRWHSFARRHHSTSRRFFLLGCNAHGDRCISKQHQNPTICTIWKWRWQYHTSSFLECDYTHSPCSKNVKSSYQYLILAPSTIIQKLTCTCLWQKILILKMNRYFGLFFKAAELICENTQACSREQTLFHLNAVCCLPYATSDISLWHLLFAICYLPLLFAVCRLPFAACKGR